MFWALASSGPFRASGPLLSKLLDLFPAFSLPASEPLPSLFWAWPLRASSGLLGLFPAFSGPWRDLGPSGPQPFLAVFWAFRASFLSFFPAFSGLGLLDLFPAFSGGLFWLPGFFPAFSGRQASSGHFWGFFLF